MDHLELDIDLALRDFRLQLTVDTGPGVFALVGPSGAGKTTLLRAVAGLARPDRGTIRLAGRTLFDAAAGIDVAAQDRRVGIVFQDYALFPHMTVAQNVAYGRGRSEGLLARFGIAHLAGERPGRLSGGERQRVALARALATEPDVLLLDEPLTALDRATRSAVRGELAALLTGLGVPTVLVTHDFDDAAVLAGQVGVLVEGRLRQVGTPGELLAAPADAFVASFAGLNLLRGQARPGDDDLTEVILADGQRIWSADAAHGAVAVAIAPWEISVGSVGGTPDSARNHITATVTSLVVLANRVRVQVGPVVAEITGAAAAGLGLALGEPAVATFKATATRLIVERSAP